MNETTTPERADGADAETRSRTGLVLVVAWCAEEPWRVGEVLLGPPGPPGPTVWFGRGPSPPGGPLKAALGQLRPGQWLPSPPLQLPALSRHQLSLAMSRGERLRVRNEGRCALLVNDVQVDSAEVGVGDLVQLGRQLLFICARRTLGPAPGNAPAADFPFAGPDRHGIVGESRAVWQLRAQIEEIARRTGHVLITGPSGSGKELVAQAIHRLSPRGGQRLVARNAATLPEGLIDAELFGNARNYPNPGMPARAGLVGDAHQGTLFLDEFAELAPNAQSHLLRVLDAGEYHRLGESQARVSDFRLIAATNRELTALKHDLLARLTFHVAVPGLDTRPDDLPLLVRHLLVTTADLAPPGQAGPPNLPLEVMRRLLRHPFRTGLRELRFLLWRAFTDTGEPTDHPAAEAPPPPLAPPLRSPAEASAARVPGPLPAPRAGATAAGAPSAEQVQRCLDENNGALTATCRALGLKNRFALLRLIKRYDLEVRRRPRHR